MGRCVGIVLWTYRKNDGCSVVPLTLICRLCQYFCSYKRSERGAQIYGRRGFVSLSLPIKMMEADRLDAV